jgi:hypothetical protein
VKKCLSSPRDRSNAATAKELIEFVCGKITNTAELNAQTKTLLRNYYYEVDKNIDFLKTYPKESFKGMKSNNPIVKNIVNRINTENGRTIITGSDKINRKALAIVQKVNKKHLIRRIIFTQKRIEELKVFSERTDNEIILARRVLVGRRIESLLNSFIKIKDGLRQIKGVKEIIG